jgi:colanic acid biosynthesis glycosyl transferase WcaI
MPSKILGMMASGKPSLVLGSKESEVKRIFENSKAGLFFNNYSKNLINKLDELMNNPLECKKMGKAARKFVVSNFSKEDVLCRMTLKVESLLRSNQFIPY